MLTNLPPSCALVMKSGNLNFLEPSGPLQACNGTALPLPFTLFKHLCLLVQCTQLSRELAVQGFLTEPQGSIEHSLGNACV